MPDVALTWLGHASFRFDTPGGKRVYIDPFLDNPKCPGSEKEPERIDILALTHGHSDHVGSSVDLINRFKPTVVGMLELVGWLGDQGAKVGEMPGTNKGGTREVDGVKFTMTDAKHSSSGPNGDHFTMDPRQAAVALELLGVDRCIPCHYGTFPLLTGTPDELRGLTDVELIVMEPGQTVTL